MKKRIIITHDKKKVQITMSDIESCFIWKDLADNPNRSKAGAKLLELLNTL